MSKQFKPGQLVYRHGDVLILKSEHQIPFGAVARKSMTVALGEMTGHEHILFGGKLFDGAEETRNEQGDVAVLFQAEEGAKIRHLKAGKWTKEHYDIPLDLDLYEIRVQRQWSSEGWEYVAD